MKFVQQLKSLIIFELAVSRESFCICSLIVYFYLITVVNIFELVTNSLC